MEKDYFLLKDKIQEIEDSFINDGWIKAYTSDWLDSNNTTTIYCCLIDKNKRREFIEDDRWLIHIGSEGKPSVYGDNTYKTYDKEGVEPFLFCREFSLIDSYDKYFDVSEEFILYFNLYEKVESKQKRKYYYIDEVCYLDEVIVVEPDYIKIKLKYLKEYITIRDMNFVVCFDFMRIIKEFPNEWELKSNYEIINSPTHVYSHLIRNWMANEQSWIRGKVFIECNKEKKSHFDFENKYEKFLVGYNENGEEEYEDCSKTNEKFFKLTYFKKEVLNKYYNEPSRYEVDGFGVRSKYFSLKIDNNVENYVPVFLVELSSLPYKEQLHWKQYNILPQDGMNISRTYYRTMIEGEWAEEPETPDLYFKSKYEEFNEKWEQKFGWRLYKKLAKQDQYYFKSLHIPTTNNVNTFCEQILSLVKLIIDRLNEEKLSEEIVIEKGDQGITKFEKYFLHKNIKFPKMIEFLRNLQNLRSGLIAHSFSKSNKKCEKAIKYFDINEDSYRKVARDIFIKSINILNTLEKIFLYSNKH